MAGSCRGVVPGGDDQFAAAEVYEGDLDGAFGKAGRVGQRSQTCGNWFPFVPGGLAVKIEINQIRGWLLIVPDQIAHQDVEDVIVDGNGFAKPRHGASRSETATVCAIPINGQHFLATRCARLWTRRDDAGYVQRIMIKQLKFVSIPVNDQNRALDFYTDKLGFTIITDQPFDEKQRWIELRIPKAETRVVLFTPEGDEKRIGSFMNMSYACDDIDKTYEELKKRGVEFEGPPQKQPWGTYAMFKDSEGNRFVVSSD